MMSCFFAVSRYFKFLIQVKYLVKWLLDIRSYFIGFPLAREMSFKILVKKFKCCENVTFV